MSEIHDLLLSRGQFCFLKLDFSSEEIRFVAETGCFLSVIKGKYLSQTISISDYEKTDLLNIKSLVFTGLFSNKRHIMTCLTPTESTR